jgi:hypothetical protein
MDPISAGNISESSSSMLHPKKISIDTKPNVVLCALLAKQTQMQQELTTTTGQTETNIKTVTTTTTVTTFVSGSHKVIKTLLQKHVSGCWRGKNQRP